MIGHEATRKFSKDNWMVLREKSIVIVDDCISMVMIEL